MDNNFIKDMRACQIESRLTAEQIGQLTNLDNLYELIDIAYKAGYIAVSYTHLTLPTIA